MKLTFTEKQIPHLIILAVAVVFLILTAGWPYETYLFPRLICSVVILTVLLSLFSEMREQKKSGTDQRDAWQSGSMSEGTSFVRMVGAVVAWLFLYLAAIWLVGYEYASVVFIFCFMKFQGKQTWMVSTLAAVVALAFVMLVFGWGLGIKWPDGLLQATLKQ
jgi:hypothetical protein